MVTAICFGGNWLDTDDNTRITLQWANNLIEFGDPKMMHTLDLSVPATDKNCAVFAYGENEGMNGTRLRVSGYLSIDGILLKGLFGLVSAEGGRFNILFVYKDISDTGLDRTLQSLVYSNSTTLSFDGKDDSIPNTTMTWGWVNYGNSLHPSGSMGTSATPMLMPSANLGYIMNLAASEIGFTVYVDGVNITTLQGGGIPTSPYSYIFTLPTCLAEPDEYMVNVRSFTPDMRTAQSPTISVTKNGVITTLADAGLDYVEPTVKNYSEGFFNTMRRVRNFKCTRDIKIHFPQRNMPNYTYNFAVAFAPGNQFKEGIGLGNVPAVIEYTTDAERNDQFSFVNLSYWQMGYLGASSWQYWRLNAYNHESISQNQSYTFNTYNELGAVGSGQAVNLWNNLPDMTLIELVTAFCRIVCGGFTYDLDNSRIDITTFTGAINSAKTTPALIDNGKVLERGMITRHIEGWAQHNYITTSDDNDFEQRYQMDLQVNSPMVDEERELGKIDFRSGGFDFDGTGQTPLYNLFVSDDVERDDNGNYHYNENTYIAYLTGDANVLPQHLNYVKDANNENFNTFTKNTDEVAVSVLMPLTDFVALNMGSTAALFGRSWLIRSATWSDGVAELKLLSINFADMQ